MRLLLRKFKKRSFAILLLLFVLPSTIMAQTKSVTGVVKNSKGDPLSNVTVTVKGSRAGVATAADGTFTISVAQGATLLFTSVNFEASEIRVGAGNNYNVVLADKQTVLTDVVVVGYGKSSRKNLSSAVTTIRPEELNKGAIGDVGQLLQGKVAGLNITSSGDPNRPAAVILRGASTVNSPGDPFYVIDGIPGADIAAVAPDDIASIEVLKDAAAAAIYGNRASSGVIMVSTKRGRKGQSSVSYNGYVGVEKVSNSLDLMDAAGLRAYLMANSVAFSPNDDKGADTDWQSAIQNSSAISHNHNLSFTGSGEHSTYSASLNYFDKEGILQKSHLKRLNARLSFEQTALNDKVKFGMNVLSKTSNANYTPLQNIVLLQAARHSPVSPIKNADGTYFENLNTTGYFNPLAIIDNAQDDTKYTTLIGGFTLEVKLPFNLQYNTNLFYQKTTSLHGEFYSSYYGKYPTSNFYNNPDPGIGIAHTLIGGLFGTSGSALRSTFNNTTKTIESYLTWNKKIKKHSINAVAGYSWQQNIYGEGFQTSSTNFPADNLGYSNLVLGNPYAVASYRINLGNDLTYGETRLISDFFRVNYNFDDKYLLQASVRRDGSSVFGANNFWGYFPSVGAAWRISQESFMQNQNIFTDLKLRASYGVTGNSGGIGAYTAKLVYGITGTYYNNGVQAAAYGPIQGSNPDLRWEKTATTNIGLDFTVLKGKLSGSIDWYDKNTTDMLFNYSVSASLVPGGRIWANGGSINNKGIELSLTATPVSTTNFRWISTLNLAHNKNLITSLQGPYNSGDSIRYSDPEGPGQTNSTLQLLKVGYPLGQFFTLSYAGKDANGISQFNKRNGTVTTGATAPGIGTDYWYMGDAQPKLLMGWSNTLKYKRFDLNVFFRGVFGNKIFNATRADLSYVTAAAQNNILTSAADDKVTDTKNSFYSNRYIESGTYVRLDNATLAYSIASPIKYVNNIRVYTSVNNLFTITKYKGIDPEISQGGVAPGIDYNNFYPKTRTILLGVNVSF
ncbi:SusC/RagA family TonB-linked outer membrane protein [Ferruginibacter sp.]|nr:SusC/RagA family TonB-linked outer membrane protein [Ferruginibacter sp.]